MSMKQLYQRFRYWQRNPLSYKEIGSEMHCCCNCGQEYAGAYCPRCGQKARAGRITWTTIRNGLMDVFGLGGRSLPYSVWQLLWRPGYFISDYINGKWQVSFPPVKMLVIVTVLVFFIGRFLFPEYWGEMIDDEQATVTSTGVSYFIDSAINWLSIHPEWGILFLFSFLILPTWFVFRHAPRNPLHTLPQGFFIQVFMTTQFFIWNLVLSMALVGTGMNAQQALAVSVCLLPLMVLLDYKQLFGYGWRGTLWRMAVVAVILALTGLMIAVISVALNKPDGFLVAHRFRPIFIFMSFAAGLGTLLSLTDAINRRSWWEQVLWRSMLLPLLFFTVMVISLIVLEIQRPGAFFNALVK